MSTAISQPTTSSSGVSGASSPRLVWVNIAATVVGVLALVAVLVALHLGHLYDIFNGDSAYLPLVLEDILADPANFHHWYPSTTSFYFPDWILFGLPYLVTHSFYFSMAVVIVLHTLILFAIVYAINRQFDRSLAWVASVATTVLLLFLALQDGYVHEHRMSLFTFRFMIYTLWHYGTFLVSLLSFFLLIKLQTHSYTKGYAGMLSLLGVLLVCSVASDQIMLVWFSGPAVAALAYQWCTRATASTKETNRRTCYTMGVVVVSSIVGKLIYPLTVVHDFANRNTLISLSNFVEDVQVMTLYTGIDLASFPLVNSFVVGLNLLVLVGLVCRKKFANIPAVLRLSMVYMLMVSVATFAAILFTHSPFAKRYSFPIHILPLIMAPSVGLYWYRRHISAKGSKGAITRRISYALLMVSGVLLQITVLRIIQNNDEITPGYFAYTFSELQCIDQVIARYNLRYGVASYNYAKALHAMSSHDIQIAQYMYDETAIPLTEFHWMTSTQYFRDQYDFAIEGTEHSYLWVRALLRNHAAPLHRTVCGSTQIFIFPNGGLSINTEKKYTPYLTQEGF